ncbi:MAG: DegT/DnrJ/EryC1/StrS family aminotransferase [Candidatus Rokubacteria bacterium]|nr:DegT/DnrJ/EryC1/StrS family aminotransferase [Candidatus Rokubacteria bacterium]
MSDVRLPIRVAQPYFGDIDAVLADLRTVLETGCLMDGPFIHRFEQAFREHVGTANAIAVNSCTTALEIIFRYLDVRGGEVIVPANTFPATANAVLYAGGTPVFADIDPATFCLDAEEISRLATRRTRAVVVVHIAGLITPRMDAIQESCRAWNLPLVEDCAHAHGAMRRGRPAGALGTAAAFSFYPTKIITTGTGGMITTDDQGLADFAQSVRCHGRGGDRGTIENLGNNWFMNEMSAVVGLHQVRRITEIVDRRIQIAERYRDLLSDMPGLWMPAVPSDTRHSYYKIPAVLESGIDVATVRQRCLEKWGLELESVYHPPCHLQPVYRRLFGFRPGVCPVAEDVLSRQVCLPVHMGIEDSHISHVVDALRDEVPRSRS